MHESGLALHVIDSAGVQHTAVIPQYGIAHPPLMAILKRRLACVRGQIPDKAPGFVVAPAHHSYCYMIAKIKALTAAARVTPHQRTLHRDIGFLIGLIGRGFMTLTV
jgi:hypothetical protein